MDKNKILIALSESDKTDIGKRDFATQSCPQKGFSAIWTLESEVNDGGFFQYFLNRDETAGFAGEALQTINASRAAEICPRAIAAAFPGGLPPNTDGIASAAPHFSQAARESFDALDHQFYHYPDESDEPAVRLR